MLDYIDYALSNSIYNTRVVVFCLLIYPFLSFKVVSLMIFRLLVMDRFFSSNMNDGNFFGFIFLYLYFQILADDFFLLLIKALIYYIIK